MALNQGATNLRRALEDPNGFIVAPGVYDGLSARLALAAGFESLYMVSIITPGCSSLSNTNTDWRWNGCICPWTSRSWNLHSK